MKLVIAATGASGTIYLQRLLDQIDCSAHEVHLVLSAHAKQVAEQELDHFKIPASVSQHSENDLNVPFVSGSARFDAMVVVPCSLSTVASIAHGITMNLIHRAASVSAISVQWPGGVSLAGPSAQYSAIIFVVSSSCALSART